MMKYNGVITPQGALRIFNRKLFDQEIASMSKDKDFAVTVEVRPRKKFRSDMQNAYYWKVVVAMISERLRDLGHNVDRDLAHEFLKNRFLYSELIDPATGEVIKIPKKTKELSPSEFMDYLEQVKIFASEILDIYIPDPNEQLEIE